MHLIILVFLYNSYSYLRRLNYVHFNSDLRLDRTNNRCVSQLTSAYCGEEGWKGKSNNDLHLRSLSGSADRDAILWPVGGWSDLVGDYLVDFFFSHIRQFMQSEEERLIRRSSRSHSSYENIRTTKLVTYGFIS